jgi:Putative Flp pilus-assembly TadE/G-like
MALYASIHHRQRKAKTLVLFCVLSTVLVGWVGLVIDGGLLMAGQRQAQNAADAAAIAGAMDKMRGNTNATALATANNFLTYNGLSNAPALVLGTSFNIPPKQGPHKDDAHYVEVIVTNPVGSYFIQALSGSSSANVTARAVAGFEAVTAGEGSAVLDPTAVPGLSISGGATLLVHGRVVINSQGAGYDENGNYINLGYPQYGVTTNNNSNLQATDIRVVGGVDTPANFQNVPGNIGSPLHAGELPEPDPLENLSTPTTANGVDSTSRGAWKNGTQASLLPGVYDSIEINNSNYNFPAGIYVVKGGNLKITGNSNVTGNGVMFYMTGSDYDPTTGAPDSSDGSSSPPTSGNPSFGGITINGGSGANAGTISLTGLNDSQSQFNGMLFYQRRWNTQSADINGGSDTTALNGTIYAKWARFKLDGSGVYNSQFLVGSLALSGQANITINYAGKNLGKAPQVFLVE